MLRNTIKRGANILPVSTHTVEGGGDGRRGDGGGGGGGAAGWRWGGG